MTIAFVGIDPETDKDHCPAVFVDVDTGDLVFQGWAVTDPNILAEITARSPIADDETVVRLPARMASIVRDALAALEAGDGGAFRIPRAAGRV